MSAIETAEDLLLLRESVDVEFKLAGGRDGKGEVPGSMWETYSAFANTLGGSIFLGVREKNDHTFEIAGITEVDRVRKDLFNTANNQGKVSANLLTDQSVSELVIEGNTIIQIEIPRVKRTLRPIYLNGNPLGNTYRRQHESDQRVSNEEVNRMLAERVEDERDGRILKHFDLDDLHADTLRIYRQVFANRTPGHPWNELDDREFLRQLGGWRKDRETGDSGLTLAGLLMFGTHATIQELLPNYMLDYQERPEARTEQRWVDRVTLDGTWSGNLYDFYRKVYAKLTDGLKVPFELKDGERQDDTPVHEALREALANVLVHADYSDRASVLVVKRPDMFGFRNPGLMRVPPEIALQGGEHDCRNRKLHAMFRHVGVGEQAGSGIPKILHGWKASHWRPPSLWEKMEPFDQTLLELHMLDLFPEGVMESLKDRFGEDWDCLDQTGQCALAIAATEGTVNHARLREVSDAHPVDLSKVLQNLTHGGLLESTGGRGAIYYLEGEAPVTPEEVFGGSSKSREMRSLMLGRPVKDSASDERDAEGRLMSQHLEKPVIDDLGKLANSFRESLESIASEPREKARIERDVMVGVILAVCRDHFITLRSLASLLNRQPDTIRDQYLTKLVRERRLSLAFPATPNHERQAYTAAGPGN